MGCDPNFTSLVPGSIIEEGPNGCKNQKNRISAAKLSIKDGKIAPKNFYQYSSLNRIQKMTLMVDIPQEWEKYHKTPSLDNELIVINDCLERKNQSSQ